MPKCYAMIGFSNTKETSPGIWTDETFERPYSCEILSNMRRNETNENLNDNFNISNRFSILSDHFLRSNFHSIKYIKYANASWKVSSVDIQYPRLILTVGGVYNG